MVVAETAGDWCAPGNVFLDERTNHVALETLLVIDYVIRDADLLRHAAGVVDIIERAAASLHRFGHALLPSESALVPELHGKADDVVSLRAQHGRDGGRIHTARHRYGNRFGGQFLAPSHYELSAAFLYTGESSRRRATVSGTSAKAKSMSSATVCLPKLKRMLARA